MKKKEPAHTHLIMGRRPVLELLSSDPERLIEIHTATHLESGDKIVELAREYKIKIIEKSKEALAAMVPQGVHQGYVARVHDRVPMEFNNFLKVFSSQEQGLILVIDALDDPQNLGALLRAAECFGVDGVMWSKNRAPSITPTVSKASVGASELVNIVVVSNLVEALKKLKQEGVWLVAADLSSDAKPLFSFKFPKKCAVVVGAEGAGLHRLTLEKVDYKVSIPLYGSIESLNVSQAASIMMYAYRAGME